VTATPTGGAIALARMRAALRPHHDRIEQVLDLTSANVSAERYRRFLERSYGFIAACEGALDAAAAPSSLHIARRCKTQLLRDDLSALGASAAEIDALPFCRKLPPVSAWPAALGYCYVMEGSTLGGQILARHFRAVAGVDRRSLAFVSGYGAETGAMWKQFLAVLEPALADHRDEVMITAAARSTFALLTEWHRG
jgi:heme oxygenase